MIQQCDSIIPQNYSYSKCYFVLAPYPDTNIRLKLAHIPIGRGGGDMDDLDFRAIGLKIRERRKHQGLTQEYVANQLDVNPSHVSNIECGHAKPSLTTLVRIANILQCSADYFLEGEYSFRRKDAAETLDQQILDKLKYYDAEKKQRILKMIELL